MPGPGNWPGRNPLLSGLFGSFQAGAAGRLSTSEIWKSLRYAAGTWQLQATGQLADATEQEIVAEGTGALTSQGVSAGSVSTYRGIAGQWLAAKTRLQGIDQDQQITAREIFQPPWATTLGPETPSRYRIRAQWEITTPTGEVLNQWGAYELTTPLTNLTDVLAQAQALAGTVPSSDWPAGGVITGIQDYELEQI